MQAANLRLAENASCLAVLHTLQLQVKDPEQIQKLFSVSPDFFFLLAACFCQVSEVLGHTHTLPGK